MQDPTRREREPGPTIEAQRQRRPCKRSGGRGQRRANGSSVAEFAPALYVLFFFAFFPMLDVLGVILSYADCQYLHSLFLRQATVEDILSLDTTATPPALSVNTSFVTDPNGSFHNIVRTWYNGFGHFTTTSFSNIAVSVSVNLAEGSPTLKYVQVTTTVQCNPLVPVPFFFEVPGFNTPETFSIAGKAVIENVPS